MSRHKRLILMDSFLESWIQSQSIKLPGPLIPFTLHENHNEKERVLLHWHFFIFLYKCYSLRNALGIEDWETKKLRHFTTQRVREMRHVRRNTEGSLTTSTNCEVEAIQVTTVSENSGSVLSQSMGDLKRKIRATTA